MEFKSDEFLHNIEIEKEKAQLKKQSEALDALKNASVVKKPNLFDTEPVIVDIKHNINSPINDLRISSTTKTDSNKKQYILLGGALIVLFILTIVIIQLISYDKDDDKLFRAPEIEKISQDNILSGQNSTIEYQKIIDQKAKKTIQKELNLDTIVQEEIPLPKVEKQLANKVVVQDNINDIFEMETKEKKAIIPIKKPIPKVVKKTIIKNITKKSGTYIQVGAFTKQPSTRLLNLLKQKNLNYIVYPMEIKGKLYRKVLIGPYPNKKIAKLKLNAIKQKLKRPSAYITVIK